MSEVKLKPCPFCGSENIMLDKTKEDTLHLAVCRNCVAQVSGFTRDGAIRAWNRRKSMDDIVAKLDVEVKKSDKRASNEANVNGHTLDYECFYGQRMAYLKARQVVKGGVED